MQEKQIEKIIKQAILKFQNGNSPHEKEYAIKNGVSEIIRLTDSLTPPDAEKEAVMFAEWVNSSYSQAWSKYNVNMSVWRDKTDLDTIWKEYTTQELFNLYKQGGK